jgi:hypothetical protein
MLTFEQFLADAADRGEAVNTLFEERLFGLVGVLHKITDTFTSHRIPHELIGGLAVLIYVEEANPEHTPLTRDVDLLVRRSDLERIKEAAAKDGFRFRHAAGVDMLIYGPAESAKNAVHLLFSGEKVRPNQTTPNPSIKPEHKHVHGKDVLVISIVDLIRMKLSSYRLKDQVHIKTMDAVGLITSDAEKTLTPELAARLKHVRETE